MEFDEKLASDICAKIEHLKKLAVELNLPIILLVSMSSDSKWQTTGFPEFKDIENVETFADIVGYFGKAVPGILVVDVTA